MKVILIAVALLSGCTTYWSKPGSTEAEFNRDNYQCMQESSSMYQPNHTQQQIGTAYETPSQTNCSSYGYNVRCTTTPGTYIPAQRINIDSNKWAREEAFKACMRSRNYTEGPKQ